MFRRKKEEDKVDLIDNLVFEPSSMDDVKLYLLISKSIDIGHLLFLHSEITESIIGEIIRVIGYFPEDIQENLKNKISDYAKKVLELLFKNTPKSGSSMMISDAIAFCIAVIMATHDYVKGMSMNIVKSGVEEFKKYGAVQYDESGGE